MLKIASRSKIWGKQHSLRKFHTKRILRSTKIFYDKQFTTIRYPDRTYSFNNTFLRDSSESSTSIEAGSGQKLFTTGSIIGQYPINVEMIDDQLVTEWEDGDRATYTRDFLDKHSSTTSRLQGRYYEEDVKFWDKKNESTFPQLPEYDYNQYITNDQVLKKVVQDIRTFGVAQITNIPTQSDQDEDASPSVAKIGERIGYLKPTLYGTIFDVRSKPNATNIADTDKFLPLHQDLLYYESPPGLQLLHFIKTRAAGGESVFADGFAAASYIKHTDAQAYHALLTVPINYHYNRDGHAYFHSHPLIEESSNITESHIYSGKDHFKVVNYSPPFQAPFDLGILGKEASQNGAKEYGDSFIFEDFLRGLKMFEEYVNDPANKLKFKTEEGTCIIFDNRRVLHARDAFDSQSGERWLKGTYLDKDAFESKLRYLKSTLLE